MEAPVGGVRTVAARGIQRRHEPDRAAVGVYRRLVGPARPQLAAVVIVALGIGWVLAIASGDAVSVNRHWFYVPVVLGAVGFGVIGGMATAIVGALLAGPFSVATPLAVWMTRGFFLVLIGALIGFLTDGLRAAAEREAEVAAREADLVRQRNSLIQTVSHEFRTPLTVINGVAQTLARRQVSAAENRRLIESLGRSVVRLNEMVSVVLAAAEATDGDAQLEQEAITIDQLIDSVVDGFGIRAGRITTVVPPGGTRFVTVPAVLELVVRCLVDNALKFSPPDAGVEVIARRTAVDVIIEVRDRGPGIATDVLDRVFDPFTQGDPTETRVYGGLGMGLYAARQLVGKLGGSLRLRPRAGGGTAAVVTLPQRRAEDRFGRLRIAVPPRNA